MAASSTSVRRRSRTRFGCSMPREKALSVANMLASLHSRLRSTILGVCEDNRAAASGEEGGFARLPDAQHLGGVRLRQFPLIERLIRRMSKPELRLTLDRIRAGPPGRRPVWPSERPRVISSKTRARPNRLDTYRQWTLVQNAGSNR